MAIRPNLAFAVLALLSGCGGTRSEGISKEVRTDQTHSGVATEISHAQLYASADGETHFKQAIVPLTRIATAPPAQPVAQSETQAATTIRHAVFEPNWGSYDRDNNIFHVPSSRRFVTVRRGVMWVKASDGETRKFQAGDILEILDVAPSKGHITWAGAEPVIAMYSNFEQSSTSVLETANTHQDAVSDHTQLSKEEEVYVVRARPTTMNLPVTSFCDEARFPATHPAERERSYEYFSIETQRADGMVLNPASQSVGGHRGCYSRTVDGKLYTYGKGKLAGISFTIRGSCMLLPERSPQAEASPYTCDYVHSDMPGYIGGQSLWNGMTTSKDGYLTTTIGSVRLWKRHQ